MQGFLFCLEIVQNFNKESDKFEIVVFKNQTKTERKKKKKKNSHTLNIFN